MVVSNGNGFLQSLPLDLLIEEIFLRLPSKSLLRCKSVCKEWYAIISSKSFIDKHYNRPANCTRLLFYESVCNVYDREGKILATTYSFFPDVDTCERHQAPDNLVLWGKITFIRGPCNGIYCVHIKDNRFALWNPTTTRFRPILCSPSHKFDEVGFGMDPITGDFKIVLIRSLVRISPCFAVYTSSNHSWRYSEQESLGHPSLHIPTISSILDSYTFLNGTYYWLIHHPAISGPSVLAFDMHNEVFQQIETPDMIGGRVGVLLQLFNDSVALISNKGYYAEIWLLEEKGYWTKFLSLVLPVENALLYGLCGRNKVLWETSQNNSAELVAYDFYSHNSKVLNVEKGHDEHVGGYLSIHYKESLASVKGEHGIEDYDTRSVNGFEFLGYKGPYTDIDCFAYRQDAQIGTEEEKDLMYDPSLDYPPSEDFRDPYANYHPYGEVAEEDLRYSSIPYDPYYYNDEDYLHQSGMGEYWRDLYADDQPYLDSEGNPCQLATEAGWSLWQNAVHPPILVIIIVFVV